MGILPTKTDENFFGSRGSRREQSRIAQGNPERSRRGRPGKATRADSVSPVGATECPQLIFDGAKRTSAESKDLLLPLMNLLQP